MKQNLKLKRGLTLLFTLSAMANIKAETFTADDFVANDKFCTQLFWTSNLLTETPRPQYGCWSRFEYVTDKNGDIIENEIKLKSFHDGGEVYFTIEGDRLILDGLDRKNLVGIPDGVSFRTSDGKKGHLVTVKKKEWKAIAKPKNTYYYFDFAPKVYDGVIKRESDGSISIRFENEGAMLQINRQQLLTNIWTWDDIYNTFGRIDLRVFDANGYMGSTSVNDNSIPIHITYNKVSNDSEEVFIRNFAGCGIAFSNESVQSYSFYENGVRAIKNLADGTFVIPRQAYAGKLNIDYTQRWGASVAKNTYIINGINIENKWIEGSSHNLDIAGSIKEVHSAQPGWRKEYGGSLAITSNSNAESEWRTFSMDEQGNQTELEAMGGYSITKVNDVTPNASFADLFTAYSDWGIYLEGKIAEGENSRLVDSYDIFVIPEIYTRVSVEQGFTKETLLGHDKAVKATQEPIYSGAEDMSFKLTVKMADIEAAGWNPYDLNGKFTTYIRFNLVNTGEPASARRRAGSAKLNSLPAFGSLTPASPMNIPTSVDDVTLQHVKVYTEAGAICIDGTDKEATVYSLDGKVIYNGFDAVIPVEQGLYLVNVAGQTYKVLAK